MARERVIIRKTEQEIDEVGKPISIERLQELYSEWEYLQLCTFVRDLKANNWSKFCISRQPFRFAKDSELRFFEIGELKGENLPELVFLGRNKAPGTSEIYNQVAAESWGFAVLVLPRTGFPKGDVNEI